MKLILSGCNGEMGRAVTRTIFTRNGSRIVAGVDRTPDKYVNDYPVFKTFRELQSLPLDPEAIIDFSHPFYLEELLDYAVFKKIPAVLATTGYDREAVKRIEEAAWEIPIIFTHNTSRSVHVLLKLIREAAELMEDADIELVEKHSRKKLDAPSGTTRMIVDALEKGLGESREIVCGRKGREAARSGDEIGVHSIRAGGNKSEHAVSFTTMGDALEIRHTTFSYEIFAQGAVDAAAFLIGRTPGLYDMGRVIDGK